MNSPRTTLTLHDFGMGVLGGLTLRGVRLLNDQDLLALNRAFKAAFDIVQPRFEHEGRLGFYIILDPLYQRTPDVDEIISWWLRSGYATKDAPGVVIRFAFGKEEAERLLESVPGTAPLWKMAAGAFLRTFPAYFPPRR